MPAPAAAGPGGAGTEGRPRTAATVERDNKDVVSLAEVLLVVNSVKGDQAEGEDGELYAAFGYVRKSERKTGKTNKPSKKAPLGP